MANNKKLQVGSIQANKCIAELHEKRTKIKHKFNFERKF